MSFVDMFECIAYNGTKRRYELVGNPPYPASFDDHIQGYAKYFVEGHKDYDILSLSDRETTNPRAGWLVVLNDEYEFHMRTPIAQYSHPGGFQIVDNFLYLVVEICADDAPRTKKDSYICRCDLTPLHKGKNLSWDTESIRYFDHKAGMVGVAKVDDVWYFGIHDNKTFRLYQAKNKSGLPNMNEMEKIYYKKDDSLDFQNLNLFYSEEDKKLYLVGFMSRGKKLFDEIDISFRDSLTLYEIEIKTVGDEKKVDLKFITEKHCVTNTTECVVSSLDTHFRFGAGLSLSHRGELIAYGTTRRYNKTHFWYDVFDSVNVEGIYAELSSDERCSKNFRLNVENGYNIQFWASDSSGHEIPVRFSVMEDITAAGDKNVYQKIINNETRCWNKGNKGNLYIAKLKRLDGKTDGVWIKYQVTRFPVVNCTGSPYNGQKHRASYDFSTAKMIGEIHVKVFVNYGTEDQYEDKEIKFDIMRNNDDAADDVVLSNVGNDTVITSVKESKLYVGLPKNVSYDKNFTVIFEEK